MDDMWKKNNWIVAENLRMKSQIEKTLLYEKKLENITYYKKWAL